MKVSEVTILNLKDYCRVEGTEEDAIFTIILAACKQYILSQTGLTELQIDEKEDLTIALMVLADEMYENRNYTVKDNKVNLVVDSIINQYRVNFL